MRRVTSVASLVAALAVCSAAVAQDWAKANLAKSPRHGEYVTIHEPGGRDLQAWVVYPEVKDKAPVVVMIHEIFGLTDWAREMADEVAGAGYIVVEPDLLSGFGPARTTAESGPAVYGCDPMPCAPGQTPTRSWHADETLRKELVLAAYGQNQPQQPSAPVDHHAPAEMQAGGQAYVPARPGGTAAFPDQGAVIKAVSSLPDPQVLADSGCGGGLGQEAAGRQREAVCGGVLLGWRQELSVCNSPARPKWSVCFLWTASAAGADEEHYRAGVRVLCGQ